jgi:hypothetical protein
MTVYGTRPEAIKMAPVIKALEASDVLDSVIVVTGQHREMLDQVNEIFEIQPDHDLDIFEHGASLSKIVARVLERLDPVLEAEKPAAVIVQGDTSTSTAAALAAFHRQIPVVHLEAGLRSGDITSPFPEEANRKLTSQLAALHLAPTHTSKSNLVAESVPGKGIVVTGNTVIDALLTTVDRKTPFTDPALEDLADSGRRILLVTTHRRENWGGAMEGVGRALARIARRFSDRDRAPGAPQPGSSRGGPSAAQGHRQRDNYRAAALRRIYAPALACRRRAHRLRRRPGRGPEPRQAGAGDAREHGTARSGRSWHGPAHRYRRESNCRRGEPAPSRPGCV